MIVGEPPLDEVFNRLDRIDGLFTDRDLLQILLIR